MKHEVITIMASLLCGLSIFPSSARAKYGGGSGEPNDPFLIYTAEQMNAIGADTNDWDKCFLLCADIDLSGYTGPDQPPPPYAYDPVPANGATGVSTNAVLRWKAGTGATSHDVYFGTGSMPPFVCNQTFTTFDPGTMVSGTNYYWRIDEVNDSVTTTGEIWNFTTYGPPPPPPSPMAEVDLIAFTGTSFNIIGYYSYLAYESFTGVFDGNGHTISNFTYNSTGTSYIGIFGCVDDPNAEIKNLGLIEANVNAGAGSAIGLLVGYLRNGSISNCYVEGGRISGSSWEIGGLVGNNNGTITNCRSSGYVLGRGAVGGLVGSQDKGTITNCHSSCEVSGDSGVGGLVGNNWSGTVASCCSTGDVSGGNNVGGLVGYNGGYIGIIPPTSLSMNRIEGQVSDVSFAESTATFQTSNGVPIMSGYASLGERDSHSATITNCYSTGSVTGSIDVGGLVGESYYSTISNCYSTGDVSGDLNVGGFLGLNEGEVYNSFWDIETSGRISSDGGIGKTTAEMHMASTFLGWGCEPAWTIDEGNDYPRLAWENAPGEPITTPSYGGGTGEPNDPFLIYTAEQLNTIGSIPCHLDKHFKLMADIDLGQFDGKEGREMFNIIGVVYDNPFNGVFDGNGHTILNFTYDSNDRDYIGLFGYVYGGDIKNLGLINPNVDAGTADYVGSLVGCLYDDGNITDCYVEGGGVKGYYCVGGLVGTVGYLWGGSDIGAMTNCYSTCNVSGYHGIGGLVGANRGTITNCYSSRDVSGFRGIGGLTGVNYGTISCCYSNGDVEGGNQVGGLVGGNGGTITNSYANGGVLASEEVGGLVGRNGWYFPMLANDFGTISKCYSTGSIIGASAVGGLVGYNQYGEVLISFWDIEASGLNWSDGGTGLPTADMQDPNIFIEAGWDFVGQPDGPHDIWAEPEGGGYPILWWQLSPLASLPAFSGGSGTADDPYLISTPNDLNHIGHNPRLMDAHFKLISDIDLIGYEVYIIGSQLFPFTGEFYGNGHKISNFTYSSTATGYVGLFGFVGGGRIRNLGLIDPNVDAGTADYVGSLVGRLNCGTITNCYVESGSVTGDDLVGGLVGVVEENYYGAITNCYSSAAVSGDAYVGGLVGRNYDGAISNCYSTGSVTGIGGVSGLVGGNDGGIITGCYSSGNITGDDFVGGLVGFNRGTITNCYSLCSISGAAYVGGVVGENNIGNVSYCDFKGIVSGTGSYSGGIAGINGSRAKISNCYSSGSVQGNGQVGGLAGGNSRGIISDGIVTNCYSTSSVEGNRTVGGLIGLNKSVVENSYSTGSVSGVESVGGLVGKNSYNTYGYGDISKCYSSGSVSGTTEVGGLVGLNESGTVSNSFWDIQTSGQSNSDGGTGKTTAQMQVSGTFIDAGWDFVNVWWIIEGVGYPRHLWEVPVLHVEPELTLGTSNTISWDVVLGAMEYYAECAEDANFISIVYSTGWITETSCEFTGLQLGQRYWYSVKARNAAGIESLWSNVESSLQCSLSDAVEIILDPNNLKSENLKKPYINKINIAREMIDEGLYEDALNKLQNDILQKTDGCAKAGRPDKNDWIITCEQQAVIYPLIIETIEHLKGLME